MEDLDCVYLIDEVQGAMVRVTTHPGGKCRSEG